MTQKIFEQTGTGAKSLFVYSGKEYNEQLQLDAIDFADDKNAYDDELQDENVYVVCDSELTIKYKAPTYGEARDYCNWNDFS